MFDSSYKFRYINSRTPNKNDFFIKEHKLTFSCRKNQQYIVNVEEYKYDVYIIKFHLKAHSDSNNKYSLLTNLNNATKVISTCIKIMLSFYEKNQIASFGFIGANLLTESISNTKRFRIYKKIMENLFSPVRFHHYNIPSKSAYLLLNKSNSEPKLLNKIEQMFNHFYVWN